MIVLRTECGAAQGWGHLMRCLAIADAVRGHGGDAMFVVSGDVAQARSLAGARYAVDAAAEGWEHGLKAALLDGYSFGEADAARIVQAGAALAVMDDDGRGPFREASVIVNGNLLYARADLYASAPRARLLLGPDYAPLRAGLQPHRREEPVQPSIARVLVVPGGSDAGGLLVPAMDILLRELPPRVSIHIAAATRGIDAGGRMIEWVRDPAQLAAAMGASDIAISAGGMSSYELAFLGIPSILVPASPIQAPVSAELERLGAAIMIPGEDLQPKLPPALRRLAEAAPRQAMRDAGLRLFDGRGAARIASELLAMESRSARKAVP